MNNKKQKKLEPKVIKLQSVFRGYLVRKNIKKVREQVDARPLLSNRSIKVNAGGKIDFGTSKFAREITIMPEPANAKVKETEQRLGRFKYQEDMAV